MTITIWTLDKHIFTTDDLEESNDKLFYVFKDKYGKTVRLNKTQIKKIVEE